MNKQTGIVKSISDPIQLKPTLKKVTVVIDTEESYSQEQPYELLNDKIQMAKDLKPGDRVQISYYLRTVKFLGQDGNVRYYHSLRPYSIDKIPEVSIFELPEAPKEATNILNDKSEHSC